MTATTRAGAAPGARVVAALSLTMFLVPALGVPGELVLQDTFKSMLVAFGTLAATGLLWWALRRGEVPARWHGLLWLPLLLLVWALGSMVWSHSYLAGVEAVRWFLFALLLWVGLNSLTLERLPLLATGIHWGAVLASLWVALQFWSDLRWFPQLPPPASTFLNRNFYAEFVVCTLPFSVLLAAQARGRAQMALRVFTTSFNLLALLLTGTRSVLLALLFLLPVLVFILWRYRSRLAFAHWKRPERRLAVGLLLVTLLGLGSLPTGNPRIAAEGLGQTALERSFVRGTSLMQPREYSAGSASVRLQMWQATGRLITDRPLAGVGAGAWEVEIPHYQAPGTQLETDYYAHNEYLQLLAEYGLIGGVFLLLLAGWLLRAAARTWHENEPQDTMEAPWRAITLASLLGLLTVSGAGFPWRLAGTGALFALALAILAASDLRLHAGGRFLAWTPARAKLALAGLLGAAGLTAWISWQAVAAETRLVRAAQYAYQLSRSGNPHDPRWAGQRAEMLRLVREGVAINPHYRKITPLVADELATWGDWANARWIWASVLASRPQVVALLANLARASLQAGDVAQAQAYYERAMAIRPDAPALRSIEVMLLMHQGLDNEALTTIRAALTDARVEADLVNYAYLLGLQRQDWGLAIEAQQLRRRLWPQTVIDSWLRTGEIHARPEVDDPTRALAAFQAAVDAAPQAYREQVRQRVPPAYRKRLR